MVNEWMRECEGSHGCCSPKRIAVALPTRVVDVSLLKLHQSTPGETSQYAALTYCWGLPVVRGALVQSNLDGLREDIGLSHLPRTVKDAISVTQRLGLRFLWIDAFCIMQDSEEDKTRELAQMAEIYSCAHITLSAASAASVEDGFLQPWVLPPSIWPEWACRIVTRSATGTMANQNFPRLCVDYCGPEVVMLADDPVWQYVQDPVDKRAWTFQERLLSPRILVFGSETLRWKCDGRSRSNGSYKDNSSFQRTPSEAFEDSDLSKHVDTWQRIVKEYSGRSLTREEDKLITLSPVASKFGRTINREHTYVAGLWHFQHRAFVKEFIKQLQWVGEDDDQRYASVPRLSNYVAPSWSWASQSYAIHFPWLSEEWVCHTDVVRCKTTPRARELPHGSVLDAQLCVRSRVRQADVVLLDDPAFGNTTGYIQLPVETLAREQDQTNNIYRRDRWWI